MIEKLNLATTRLTRALVTRILSERISFRGGARRDGRATLLTVDYHSRADVERLLASYRRFISPTWPAVVVVNSGLPRRVRGARAVGLGRNLHHGLGLDFGMRFVSTEYVLICDPDSIVAGDLWPELQSRVDRCGVASIDIGAEVYHPMCLAFRTELWKDNPISLRENWAAGLDVAGALTTHLGGLKDEALLPRSRSAGPPLPSRRPGKHHHVGEVYADMFSNTLGASRALVGADAFGDEEGSFEEILRYHERWRAWAEAYVAGRADLDAFPTG